MNIGISNNKLNELENIASRIGLDFTKIEKLVAPMLFREYQKFIAKPITYTRELRKEQRIVKEAQAENAITIPDIFYQRIETELEKTRGRKGTEMIDVSKSEKKEKETNVSESEKKEEETDENKKKKKGRKGTGTSVVSASEISTEQLINKMLMREIDLTYTKGKEKRIYHKSDFMEMKTIINEIIQKGDIPECVLAAIEEFQIDAYVFICYLLLFVRLPGTIESEREKADEYVRKVIAIKLNAMEAYIREANDALQQRERLDLINSYTDTDITSFYIRQYTQGSPISEPKCSVRELKKEIKEEFKKNL